ERISTTSNRVLRQSDGETEELLQRQSEEEEEEEIQTKLEPVQRKSEKENEEEDDDDKKVSPQARPERGSARPVGKVVERQIQDQTGRGRALDSGDRGFMEARFGVDFSRVRIHDDHTASGLARSINAQAFTIGQDIFFGQGRFETRTRNGRHLLAHELTHVVQQRQGEIRRRVLAPEAPETVPDQAGSGRVNAVEPKGPVALSDEAQTTSAPERIPVEQNLVGHEPSAEDIKPVAPVAPVQLEGNSDQVLESFLDSSASQIAVSHGTLGTTLGSKLNDEMQEVQEKTPSLKAQTKGTEQPTLEVATAPKEAQSAEIKSGVIGQEPPKPKALPHQDHSSLPNNRKSVAIVESKESGGFISWLKDNFSGVMGAIKTEDEGVNTAAGQSPKFEPVGQADPDRASRERKSGEDQVARQREEAAEAISQHPGQKNIQPVKINEERSVELKTEPESGDIETQPQADLEDFAAMPLPEDVRAAADKRMKASLQKSLASPRQQVSEVAVTRDAEKKDAIDAAQQDAALLNDEADREQANKVLDARKQVAQEQGASIKAADDQVADFGKQADQEQSGVKKGVADRIKTDEQDADNVLRKAEKEAKAKKLAEEQKAAAQKNKIEEESKGDSWWSSAVSVFKRAVKMVTEAIDRIFTAMREAVKKIIDTAKNFALDMIETGRKWIVSQLNEFGTWLKSKVDSYLSAFPALQKKLNEFIDSAVNLAVKAVNSVADKLKKGVEALAGKLSGFLDKMLAKFQTGLKAVVGIAGALLTGDFKEAAKIAFFATCEIAGIDPQPVLDFMEKASGQIVWIFKNPSKFFNNVALGVKKGVQQFGSNIKKHLIGGLISWLTGALSSIQITLPEKWDVRGVFSLVMQILGLTYENIKKRVVKKIGPKGEAAISWVEGKVELVKELVTGWPTSLWEKVKESLSDIKQIIMDKIGQWIAVTVVKEAIITVISMLNPASAILRAIKLLYNLVMWLVNNFERIVGFIESIYNSISELAAGKIAKAANFIEASLARTVPVVIGFMASLLNIGGITKTIKNIITTIRKPINKALDKVIDWLVKLGKKFLKGGKALLKKGKAKITKLIGWWKKRRDFKSKDGESHSLYFKGEAKSARLMVGSEPIEVAKVILSKEWEGIELSTTQLKKLTVGARNITKAAASKAKQEKKNEIINANFQVIETVLGEIQISGGLYSPDGSKDDPVLINWYKKKDDYAAIQQGSMNWTLDAASKTGYKTSKGTVKPDLSKGLKKDNDTWPKTRASGDKEGSVSSAFTKHLQTERDADPPGLTVVQGSELKSRKDHAATSYEIDHVRDIGLGGPDSKNNLWPLTPEKNKQANEVGLQKVTFLGETRELRSIAAQDLKEVYVKAVDSPSKPAGNKTDGKGKEVELPSGKFDDPIQIKWVKEKSDYLKVDGKSVGDEVEVGGKPYKVSQEHLYPKRFKPWKLVRSTSRSTANTFREKLLKEPGLVKEGEEEIINPPTKGLYQVDHIHDRAWGGDDSLVNIWPLRADKNNAANAVNFQIVSYKGKVLSVKAHDGLKDAHVRVVDVHSIPGSSGDHGTTPEKPAGANLLKVHNKKKKKK
ncbi:MAG: DUF4157 domain-containing protein, partial [candidate division Zixibacteria bacterium]